MKGIAVKTVITLIIIVLTLSVISSFFLFGLQTSPLEAQRIFSAGCASYCQQIIKEAEQSDERVEIVAVRLAESLRGTSFIAACNFLYADTRAHPYLCWNRNCCSFSVSPP